MRKALPLLVDYARDHRDRRNIVTHMIGVPMIVFAIGTLLARPQFELAGITTSPAWLAWLLSSAWYVSRGKPVLGAATSLMNAVLLALAHPLGAAVGTARWVTLGLGSFAVGWSFQVLGHVYEGRRPSFLRDLTSLLVGPMFVCHEGLRSLGMERDTDAEIQRQAGPTHLRDLTRPVAR